jgi:hypothetical protein
VGQNGVLWGGGSIYKKTNNNREKIKNEQKTTKRKVKNQQKTLR